MNRDSLREMLRGANVHPSLYSLDGPAPDSESYSLVPSGDTWRVLYKERGEYREIASALSESEACDLMLRLLDQAVGFSVGSPQAPVNT